MSSVVNTELFWKGNPHPIGTALMLFAATAPFAHSGLQHACASDDLTQEQSELLDEFRVNLERTEEFYMQMYMEATLQQSQVPGLVSEANPDGRSSHRVVSRRNGKDYYRVDDSLLDDAGARTGKRTVTLVSPKGTVVAEWDTEDGPPRVADWSDSPDLGLGTLPVDYKFVEAPFTAYLFPAALLIFDDDGVFSKTKRVTDVRCYNESGERLVEMSVEGVTSYDREWSGRFVFHRDASWALKECIFGHSDGGEAEATLHCQLEYNGAEDGIPLLKRATHWQEEGSERRAVAMEVCNIEKIVPGPIDEAEFTAEAIGLKIGEHRASWTRRLWLLLAAVFLVLALIIIGRGGRRHGRAILQPVQPDS